MPVAVLVLGFAIFAQGTSELVLAGLLPELAADLGVSIPQAGLLVSGFALGMLAEAPVLAVLTLRWPRRRALLAFLAVFVLVHVAGALTTSYAVLFATRFAGAFVYAGFWAVGGSTAMALVPADRRARAMSVVAGGLTVATVLGLPAGTWIGQHATWRGAFWAVAALSALAAIGVLLAVPDHRPAHPPRVRDELRGLRTGRLWLSYAMTAVSTAALLGTFTYLGAMLVTTTGLAERWVPAVLLTYGVGALAGITFGGRLADRHPRGVLVAGFTGLLAVSAALALTAAHAVAVVVLVFLLGLAGFATNPALNSRVSVLAPGAPTLAVAGNISAFNTGISVGPWLGGLALGAGLGYPSVAWLGTLLAAVALVLVGVDATRQRVHNVGSEFPHMAESRRVS
ncbi:MFS transporter, DHA1 family, chloramphenicol resistance protein [Amycolatopsis sacchari]|uniref:MFS transporter, DHA1 family, chloramphenicol resistance protein n=1 Tax=Amycolatopsis sacchari TaxID=115433 RepID=A0A1I3T3M6_9PSEU|nr:Cmx/CmrA family chloramphenicol efflux MFS transporter [Amycolatopsis sacchari]SFJ65243.1 MFS transporter, DHA1 family, chloramphenicol resistance protein [Amycolatopsis sacchari]